MAREINVVQIDGVNYGEWNRRSGGGNVRANVVRRRPTGGIRVYAGTKTIEDVTVSVDFVPSDDPLLAALVRKLNTTDGPLPMVVTRQPLDINSQPAGKPLSVDTGWVAGDNAGDYDSESDDPQSLEVTMTVESRA